MTVEEKVGQLVQYSVGTPTGPGTGRGDYAEMIEQGEVGSLINLDNVKQANQFQHIAVEKSRLHIPLLYGLDVIPDTGLFSRFRWNGFHMGSSAGGASRPCGGAGSQRRRSSLDILTNGRHCERRALGAND
jgi:hypothetical protein